ncbi:MAG: hypothetical protein KatS3mg076_3126 [Candidatus Binatia bacterium]|nr:MAG: hypothetical protein KatS3mg076_3126 [Candidatus Binatia bacterium]
MRRFALAVAGVLVLVAVPEIARALFLDEAQTIDFRARIYSQATLRTEDTRKRNGDESYPVTKAGQLIQHRNFYSPELDAKLAPHLEWMRELPVLRWLAPDRLDFRLAVWGYYDGIYDYGTSQFLDEVRRPRTSTTESALRGGKTCPQGLTCVVRAIQTHGSRIPSTEEIASRLDAGEDLESIFEPTDARDFYTEETRINELYLNYFKGPVFVRLGKQTLSWGESDTIALIDQTNPFSTKLAIPGLLQDLDEARIPLWTLRAGVKLFRKLGPFASGFVEGYWVPGFVDTSVSPQPLLGFSPYSPPSADPQTVAALQVRAGVLQQGLSESIADRLANTTQLVIFDKEPRKTFRNSRYGLRLQSLVGRSHTVTLWYYTTFPTAPVPRLVRLVNIGLPQLQGKQGVIVNEIVHDITHVFGISDTFFFEPLDTVIRANAIYFFQEPGFVPEISLRQELEMGVNPVVKSAVPRADFLRFEIGFDRFFFVRPLNPTNSFLFVTAFSGSWNVTETFDDDKDFRFNGATRPDARLFVSPDLPIPNPNQFVDLKPFDNGNWQTRIQTDYLHGRLTPGITTILNYEGAFAINLAVDYRFTDWLLGRLQYTIIDGAFHQIGFNRDRDQLAFRLTYQLN